MKNLIEYVKEHMAASAIFLGVVVMLIAGVVMIISKNSDKDNKDNKEHLSANAETSDEEVSSDNDSSGDDKDDNESGANGEDNTPGASDNPSDNPSDNSSDSSDDESVTNSEGNPIGDEPTLPFDDGSGSNEPVSKPNSDNEEGSDESGNDDGAGNDKPVGDSDEPNENDNPNNTDEPSKSPSSSKEEESNDGNDGNDGNGGNGGDDGSSDNLTEEEKFLAMDDIEYVANPDGTVTITGGSLYGDVVIPATIDGKKTRVGERAFYSYGSVSNVTSLVIKSIEVQSNAFSDCDKLVSVTFSEEVERLGENAFSDCDALTSVSFLGNKVTEIPRGLFNRCVSLTSIVLPSSVVKVNAAFITPGNYFTSEVGIKRPNESDYMNNVPKFTVYVYNEPSEVWTENTADGYKEYNSLLEGLLTVRKANISVVKLGE